MANPIEAQIKDRISSFVQELDKLVRKSTLEALRGVLDTSAGPARRGRPAGRRGPGRPRANAANVEGAAESILAHIQANDGQGVSQIASATGTALPAAKKAIGKLLAAGQISKSGQKRGTRYHAGRRAGRMMRAAKRTKRGKRRGRKAKAA